MSIVGAETKKKSQWVEINKNGTAMYEFKATGQHQIDLKAGERVFVSKESRGWYKGHRLENPTPPGIFPVAFITLDEAAPAPIPVPAPAAVPSVEPSKAARDSLPVNQLPKSPVSSSSHVSLPSSPAPKRGSSAIIQKRGSSITPSASLGSLHKEIGNSMREWGTVAKQYLLSGEAALHHRTRERMSGLLELRRRVMNPEIKEETREALRLEIIQLIESSRKMQEGYMVPRNSEGQLATVANSTVSQLMDLHTTMYRTIKEESVSLWQEKTLARKRSALAAADKSGTRAPVKREYPEGIMQLFLDIKACIFSVGEPTELNFLLYSNTKKKFLSQAYFLQMTAAGMPEDLNMLHKIHTIFKDLDASDFESQLYLVCRIYRRGVLLPDEKANKKKGASTRIYRRPFGCAACSLSNAYLENMIDEEYCPPNADMTIYMLKNEDHFSTIHERIIAGEKNLEPAPRAKGIALGLTLHCGPLETVRAAHEYTEEHVPATAKLITKPELLDPRSMQSDFYVLINKGQFQQDKKTSAKNIEVIMRVLNQQGVCQEECIYRGGGDNNGSSAFRSSVLYHSNNPIWRERICVRLAPEVFEKCHLFFTFWHASSTAKKTSVFAFTFMRLTDIQANGALVGDKEYNLQTWKSFSGMELTQADDDHSHKKPFYLSEVSPQFKNLGPPRKESFTLSTIASTSRMTQNPILSSVIKWRSMTTPQLTATLTAFLGQSQTCIVDMAKFMRELFNAFFELLISESHRPVHGHVFNALLHFITLLTDKKINIYRKMVDIYISDIFHQPRVHHILVHLASMQLETTEYSANENLKRLCKCMNHVIKFIVASRRQDVNSETASCTHTEFKSNLAKLLGLIHTLVRAQPQSSAKSTSSARSPSAVRALISQGDSKEAARIAAEMSQGVQLSESEVASNSMMFVSKMFVVRSFPDSIEDLKEIFTPEELANTCKELIEVFPNTSMQQRVQKLLLTRNILDGEVGAVAQARAVIFPCILEQIKLHLRCEDGTAATEPYICISILQKMLNLVQQDDKNKEEAEHLVWDCCSQIISELVHFTLMYQRSVMWGSELEPAQASVVATLKFDLLPGCVTTIWAILHALSEEKMKKWLTGISTSQLKPFTTELLSVMRNATLEIVYPEMWTGLIMLQHSVVRKTMKQVSTSMLTLFTNGNNFDEEIWAAYLQLAFDLLICESLRLESVSEKKRTFIIEHHGDLRLHITKEIRGMWPALGNNKTKFTEMLTPFLFEMFGKPPTEVSEMAAEMIFDLISVEWKKTKSVEVAEQSMVDSIYAVTSSSLDQGKEFMEKLLGALEAKIVADSIMKERGSELITHLRRMHELMSSLIEFPDTALYEDDRNRVALKLMQYLESTGNQEKEMYFRYVQFLVDLHAGLKNYVEAGQTCRIQSNLLNWSERILHKTSKHAEEPEYSRKERLCKTAIAYFTQGGDYERAIEVCGELREFYEFVLYDYAKVQRTMLDQASLYNQINTQERFYPSYYRVVFYGEGFDDSIKSQEFVYRGSPLEPVMDFSNRIKQKFPKAKMKMSSEPATEKELSEHEQVISVVTLVPVVGSLRDTIKEQLVSSLAKDKGKQPIIDRMFSGGKPRRVQQVGLGDKSKMQRLASPSLRKYRNNDEICVFEYSKADQRSQESKPENEFKDLWVIRSFILIEESFPCVRRRIPILATQTQELSPIRNAVEQVRAKNEELDEKIRATADVEDVSPLSMILSGCIDAAVNGGTKKYMVAFLAPEFLENDPSEENTKFQQELKTELSRQIESLQSGLLIFDKKCAQSLRPLYEHLERFFGQMRRDTEPMLA